MEMNGSVSWRRREGPTCQVLHDDPELVADQVAGVHVDDVGVAVVAHDDDLVEEELAPLLPVQVHLLDGDEGGARGVQVAGRVHRARRALADLGGAGEAAERLAAVHHQLERVAELLVREAAAAAAAVPVHTRVIAAEKGNQLPTTLPITSIRAEMEKKSLGAVCTSGRKLRSQTQVANYAKHYKCFA